MKLKNRKAKLEAASERIGLFENYVNENLIPLADEYINDCVKNFSETKNNAWMKIRNALGEQKEKILSVKNEVVGMMEMLQN